MKLSGIRLLVENFDEAFKFYSDILGLKVIWGELGGAYASFDIGAGKDALSIFPSDFMAKTIGNSDLEYPSDLREKFVIVIEVEDVDATYADLQLKGVKFLNMPTDMNAWGLRTVHLRDTENNLLELFSPLPLEKWDEDLKEEMNKY